MDDKTTWGDPVGVAIALLNEMNENENCDELKRFVTARNVDGKLRVEVNALLESLLRVGVAEHVKRSGVDEDSFVEHIESLSASIELPDGSAKKTIAAFVTGKTGAPQRTREAALALIGNLTFVSIMSKEAEFTSEELIDFLGR